MMIGGRGIKEKTNTSTICNVHVLLGNIILQSIYNYSCCRWINSNEYKLSTDTEVSRPVPSNKSKPNKPSNSFNDQSTSQLHTYG